MSYHVKIRGFQSIRKEVAIALSGLTVIWGESHLGKSAVLRAIQAAFANRLGTEFLSVGEKSCRLEWGSPAGTLVWEKEGSATTYRVDARSIRPGRGVPAELARLGVSEVVTTDRKKFWPQFQAQGELPFILAERSESIAAELLGSNPEILQINRALRLVSNDLKQQNTLTSVLEEQLADSERRLVELESCAHSLIPIQRGIQALEGGIRQTRERIESLERLAGQIDRVGVLRGILAPVRDLRVAPPVDLRSYERAVALADRHEALARILSRRDDLGSPDPDDIGRKERLGRLLSLTRRAVLLVKRRSILLPSQDLPIPHSPDLVSGARRIEDLRRLEERYRRVGQILEAQERKRDATHDQIRRLEKESHSLHREIGDMESCPFCTAPIRDGRYRGNPVSRATLG